MFTHFFYLQKPLITSRGRYTSICQTVEIRAIDLYEARKKVEQDYPEWQVSMCWPKLEWTLDRKRLVAI